MSIPNPGTPSQQLLRYFAYEHLPVPLAAISSLCAQVGHHMESHLPDGPEKTMGMRKLLEAKDCFVRAALPPAPAYPLIPKTDKLAEFDGEPFSTEVDDERPRVDGQKCRHGIIHERRFGDEVTTTETICSLDHGHEGPHA